MYDYWQLLENPGLQLRVTAQLLIVSPKQTVIVISLNYEYRLTSKHKESRSTMHYWAQENNLQAENLASLLSFNRRLTLQQNKRVWEGRSMKDKDLIIAREQVRKKKSYSPGPILSSGMEHGINAH